MKQQLGPNQKAWIAALRSGEWKQGRFALHSDEGRCCLGVACEVAEKRGIRILRTVEGNLSGSTLDCQPLVVEWLALRDDCGSSANSATCLSLMTLNDGCGKTFTQIADIIEANPEQYFTEAK